MATSVLKQKRALLALEGQSAAAGKGRPAWAMEPHEFNELAEMEAVMILCGMVTTQVQNEQYFMGAFGRLLNKNLLAKLRAGQLPVMDCDAVTEKNTAHPPRIVKQPVTAVGQECVRRAILEMERRYCGNKTEELTGAHVIPTDREKLASLLDPRTNTHCTLFYNKVYRGG